MLPGRSDTMSLLKQSPDSYRFECMIKGRRFYKTYKSYNESYSDVKRKFLEWKVSCNKDLYVNNTYTFDEFAKIWIKEYCKEYSPVVIKNYRCNLKNWILPRLGKFKLNDITPLVLDGFINHLKSTKNKANGQDNLSNGTIKKIWQITHAILTTAYMKNLMSQNPCSKVKLELKKEVGNKPLHVYEINNYKKVMELLDNLHTDNAKVIEFAVKSGLRRSEIFGLTWDDIDFENNTISVNKTRQKVNNKMVVLPTKTRSSNRTIAMPQSLKKLLIDYKEDHPNNVFVFENVDIDAVTKWFRDWQQKHNIEKIKFHDLRHTHASLLLYKGVDIKTISERLGHSNIGITMNIYTHVMKELDNKCAVAIDSI